MEDRKLQRQYMFFDHGDVQHGGGALKENQCMQFISYRIPEFVELKNALLFAYRDAMQRNIQNKLKLVMGSIDPMYMSESKEGSEDDASRNPATVSIRGESDKKPLWRFGRANRHMRRLK